MVMTRCIYRLTLQTVSELHIGSGTVEKRNLDRGDYSEVSAVVRDTGGLPWLPGSTIKGAFRASCRHRVERLFGEAHREGADFARGELSFFGFTLVQGANVNPKVRTAVDVGTGASAARKLFVQDYVSTGAKFAGDVALECSSERFAEAKAAFDACLNTFARAEGVPIGAGKSDGLGRVRLTAAEVTVQELGRTGWSKPRTEQVRLAPADDEAWISIDLECPGPYLVFGKKEGGGPDNPEVTLPERIGDLPRMFPTGVAGALRARASWLAERDAQRRGRSLGDTAVAVKTSSGKVDRTVVQRLCGDEGYRASMAMKVELLPEPGKYPVKTTHPAGPLDPVLQAPRDGALHRRKADSAVRIRLSLRMWRVAAPQDEHDLFKALVDDVKANGLALGLGTSKGFGWFGMRETALTDANPRRAMTTVLPQDRKAKLPNAAITLPYRQVEVEPDLVGMPEPAIQAAHKARTLHSVPLPQGVSGWVDVSWCFETPMLVGDSAPGSNVRTPQAINQRPVIPGTTFRGCIRGLLEIATSARLSPHRVNSYDFPDDRKQNDKRTDFPLRGAVAHLHASSRHNPAFDRNFTPDFVQALMGFISPETGDLDPDEHAALHLKSRLSFGWAWAKAGLDMEASRKMHEVVLASPDPTSAFMDHVGRRNYPATSISPGAVVNTIARGRKVGTDDMVSVVRFLHPLPDRTLVFRGRIRFHNVTEVELGALMWAITLGMAPGSRHMIGMGRPLGAGRCFAADLRMHVERNDGAEPARSDTPQATQFGQDGGLAQPYVTAFTGWLRQNGLMTHGLQERLAAANPAYGDALAAQSGGFAYQTNEGLKRELRDPDRSRRKGIARSNGGGLRGQGRLAAMMKR